MKEYSTAVTGLVRFVPDELTSPFKTVLFEEHSCWDSTFNSHVFLETVSLSV
jgi:hypothetical protein